MHFDYVHIHQIVSVNSELGTYEGCHSCIVVENLYVRNGLCSVCHLFASVRLQLLASSDLLEYLLS